MKATRFHEYGDACVLRYEDAPDPVAGPGEVVVRVRACGINHVDVDMRNGSSRLPLQLPHTLGMECAGEIVEAGSGVEGWRVGERVSPIFQIHCDDCEMCARGEHHHCRRISMLGIHAPGGFAEYVAAPAQVLYRLPESMSYEQAAASQTSFCTGLHALRTRAQMQPGDWVLVNAAGSGVGTAAIQVVRHLGGRVIASARTDEKLESAKALGAEIVVNYSRENLTEAVREATGGRGVDVVYESVGGEILRQSIDAMATFGKLVCIGCHAGEVEPVDFIDLFRHEWTLIGAARSRFSEIVESLDLVAEGKLTPVVHGVFPLAEAAEAHRLMERREHTGKILVAP
ncbi:MAG: zinc-binding dehydrogenase [Actinobacteria bacterium]|nr:zinc-binding dehydrogenase [Actinomycetota bacterium]